MTQIKSLFKFSLTVILNSSVTLMQVHFYLRHYIAVDPIPDKAFKMAYLEKELSFIPSRVSEYKCLTACDFS